MVTVKGLTKHFGKTKAVNGISFNIEKGEIVAFLGPNGAGKTTTMRMLTGYLHPTAGSCRINDVEVTAEPDTIKGWIGYLPEDNPLYPDMKVYEYLEFVGQVRGITDLKGRMKEVSMRCGISDVIGKKISVLSRGYRQRVGVAQAILHDPDILILDEPTEGLDPNQVIELRQLIKELGKKKTIMLSTHILSEAEATCERVLILNQGELIADGTREEIDEFVKGGEAVTLEVFAGEDPRSFIEAVEQVKHVEMLEDTQEVARGRRKYTRYHYEILSHTDIREALFKLSVSRKWVLLDMHRKRISLENVFRQLTRKKT